MGILWRSDNTIYNRARLKNNRERAHEVRMIEPVFFPVPCFRPDPVTA